MISIHYHDYHYCYYYRYYYHCCYYQQHCYYNNNYYIYCVVLSQLVFNEKNRVRALLAFFVNEEQFWGHHRQVPYGLLKNKVWGQILKNVRTNFEKEIININNIDNNNNNNNDNARSFFGQANERETAMYELTDEYGDKGFNKRLSLQTK